MRVMNRFNKVYEREQFTLDPQTGVQYYSGANTLVFFDNTLIDEADSIGFQLSQNVRPIYGYHSHVWNDMQYGTKLVQGYINIHLTDSGYVPGILSALELQRRRGIYPKRDVFEPIDLAALSTDEERLGKPFTGSLRDYANPATLSYDSSPALGRSLEEAIEILNAGDATPYESDYDASHPELEPIPLWQRLADAYDAQRFGRSIHDNLGAGGSLGNWGWEPGTIGTPNVSEVGSMPYFNMQPGMNDVTYNMAGTVLRKTGFTITVVCGDVDNLARNGVFGEEGMISPDLFPGTIIQLHNVHLVAGPNMQIDLDGKPLSQLYTFIAKDIK